jgi:hypothetical protein
MNKSKYIFCILGAVYLGIAVGSILNWFSVSNNVLLGLSIASLFISLGDTVDKLVGICIWRNIYEYSLYVTSCYLTEKIDNNVLPSISIDAYNVRLNIDGLRTNKQKVPSEPLKYQNKKRFGPIRTYIKNLVHYRHSNICSITFCYC